MKNFDVRGCARTYLAVSWVLRCIILRAHKAYILCNNRAWMLFLKVDCEILFSSPIATGTKSCQLSIFTATRLISHGSRGSIAILNELAIDIIAFPSNLTIIIINLFLLRFDAAHAKYAHF